MRKEDVLSEKGEKASYPIFSFPTKPSINLILRVTKTWNCWTEDFYDFNSLPNDKILDWSKLKAFADNKMNVNERLKFDLGRVDNIVGKGENTGYQHFLLFPQYFQKASFSGSLKVVIVW